MALAASRTRMGGRDNSVSRFQLNEARVVFFCLCSACSQEQAVEESPAGVGIFVLSLYDIKSR